MPLFVEPFLADTQHLSDEEIGIYTRLLALAWLQSTCDLPNDPQWLMRRLRKTEDEYQRLVQPIIDEFWRENKQHRLEQKRQRKERAYVRKNIAQKRTAAAKRWKQTKSDDAAGYAASHDPAYAPHMHTHTHPHTHLTEEDNKELSSSDAASASNGQDEDAMLYREGKELLGPKAGSLITKLKRAKGVKTARMVLATAKTKDDPQAYIAAAANKTTDQAQREREREAALDEVFGPMQTVEQKGKIA